MQLEKLNGIVWPAIAEEVKAIIRSSKEEVVVIEAAILLKAGWEKLCHEVCICMSFCFILKSHILSLFASI